MLTKQHSRDPGLCWLFFAAGPVENSVTLNSMQWEPTEEQASVEGVVEPIDAATADADFARRAPGGQALICASEQSAVLDDEEALRARMDRLAASGAALARPAHWVGLRLVPQRIELWEGRRDRVHLRTVYERTATGAWAVERLSP